MKFINKQQTFTDLNNAIWYYVWCPQTNYRHRYFFLLYRGRGLFVPLCVINYFLYRPGKVCALCNLSERSQLGQGEMRQIACKLGEGDGTPAISSGGATPTNAATPSSTPSTPVTPGLVSPPPELVDPNQHPLALPLSRRQKAFNKCK